MSFKHGKKRALCSLAMVIVAVALTGCRGETLSATNITPTSATLNGTGECENSCDVWFQYREVNPVSGAWTSTTVRHVPGPANPLTANVSNLKPGATYEYQICGTDQGVNGKLCAGPNSSQSAATRFTTTLRLMTYNVEYFNELDTDSDENNPTNATAIQALASDIAASKASVVALEEVRRFGGNLEAQSVANALGWTGPNHVYYQGWINDPHGCKKGSTCSDKGVALISRFGLKNVNWKPLTPHYDGTLDRKMIWADVDLGAGQSLRVYATHLATGDSPYGIGYPRDQLHNAFTDLRNQNGTDHVSRAVFMGDFNLTRSTMGAEYGRITGVGYADWKDTRVAPGDPACGNVPVYACTYSNFNKDHSVTAPTQKFDWIWVKGASPTAGAVINNCASGCHSDHRPYWTDITF